MKTLLLVMTMAIGWQTAVADEAKISPLMEKDIIGAPGKEVMMITVDYAPGHSDAIHRHNAQVFVYVLKGSVVMQVRGGAEQTVKAGQTFYEGPEDVHVIGRNASKDHPAKFLVFFVKAKGAPPLVPAQ